MIVPISMILIIGSQIQIAFLSIPPCHERHLGEFGARKRDKERKRERIE